MRYAVLIGIVCLVVVVMIGCSKDQTSVAASEEITAVTQELKAKVDQLSLEMTQYDNLKARFDRLREKLEVVQEYLENDPEFPLFLMDRDLDAIEQGRDAHGSFSDYFVPNAAKALEVGASSKDIEVRMNRLISLAEKGTYLSSLVAKLMEEGGPASIRSYADAWIGESQ